MLKQLYFFNFFLKCFGVSDKSHTFASAFEKQRNLKQNEMPEFLNGGVKKEFFEKIT